MRTLYLTRYDARLSSFAKIIVAELGPANNLECAAGIRFGNETLFSECYLDLPIERVLEEHLSHTVRRDRIVEVSHLAAPNPGHSIEFVKNIIETLRALGIEWAIFTATRPLRSLLRRNGLAMIELGCAARSRVADPDSWGHYFRHDPRVMAVGQRMAFGSKGFRAASSAPLLSVNAQIF